MEESLRKKHQRDMENAQSLNELRQVKDTVYNIPTHDPQTGELNPHYKDLTGKNNPWDIHSTAPSRSIENENILYKLKELRKQYTDDKQFGYHVAKELL